MAPKFNSRDVTKSLYTNFFKKAEECFHASKNSFTVQEWNAAAINAIHSCIAACDTMCVYFLGKRHSGENHNDAVGPFKTIGYVKIFPQIQLHHYSSRINSNRG